jgi:hypothetical protein
MVEKLTSLFNAENPFTAVKERLPRLQEVRVERRIPHQASTSSNGGVAAGLRQPPGTTGTCKEYEILPADSLSQIDACDAQSQLSEAILYKTPDTFVIILLAPDEESYECGTGPMTGDILHILQRQVQELLVRVWVRNIVQHIPRDGQQWLHESNTLQIYCGDEVCANLFVSRSHMLRALQRRRPAQMRR